MACILQLTALPGHFERYRGGRSKVIAFGGQFFGRERVEITSTVDAARNAISAFAKRVHEANPAESFYVSATVARGSRKPRGYDAASQSDQLGETAFMQTVTRDV